METCVLMPRELCLLEGNAAGLLKLVTTVTVPQGTVFTPTSGTLRMDSLPPLVPLHPCDPRHTWGSYERLRDGAPAVGAAADDAAGVENGMSGGVCSVRECNWVRFLTIWPHYTPQVNVVGTLPSHNTITFTVIRTLPPETEIIAFLLPFESLTTTFPLVPSLPFYPYAPACNPHYPPFFPNSHSLCSDKLKPSLDAKVSTKEGSLSPASRDIVKMELTGTSRLIVATSIYKRAVETLMQDGPLDLSKPLMQGRTSLLDSDERRSVSSESSFSSCGTTSDASQGSYADPLLRIHDNFIQHENFAKSYDTGLHLEAPMPPRRARERALLPCHVCGKIFDRPSLLKRHMRTHTGEKPHICDVCGKGFSTSSSLNTHRRIHSGEKPHQCASCGKRFTASSNLYYHKMTHIKDKPHKCEVCGRSFPTPGDLRCHSFVHTGQWPHRCPVCGKGFSKLTNLRNHLLLHSDVKTHVNNAPPNALTQSVL